MEVWYSLEEVLQRFALAVPSHFPRNDLKNAPQKTETDSRNRPREPAEPRIASDLPDAQGERELGTWRGVPLTSFLEVPGEQLSKGASRLHFLVPRRHVPFVGIAQAKHGLGR